MKSPAESSSRTEFSVLLAADSFKGSASSEAIEKYLEAGVLRALPHAQIKKVLIADGGEGTVDAFVSGCGGKVKSVQVEDPFGRPIVARLGMLPNGCAVVETAEAAGIRFSSCTDEDARRASTYGVGQLLRAALDLGVHRIYVGLGGSATSDGGCGMAEALGALFLDTSGKQVIRGLEGLPYIAHVDMSHFDRRVYDTEIIALSDVNNPLSGKHGAIYTFGPQKGLLFSLCVSMTTGCGTTLTRYRLLQKIIMHCQPEPVRQVDLVLDFFHFAVLRRCRVFRLFSMPFTLTSNYKVSTW